MDKGKSEMVHLVKFWKSGLVTSYCGLLRSKASLVGKCTDDHDEVTCKACKKTHWFRNDLKEQSK